MAKELPLQRICELLKYDEESGTLLWKKNRGGTAKLGDVAGCRNSVGYLQVYIDNIPYYAHRIIYALAHAQKSIKFIDHVDGDRGNNKLPNLREVSPAVNAQNNKVRGTSLSRDGWCSSITKNYQQKHLGCFKNEEEAHSAYLSAKQIYHPEAMRNIYGN